MCTESAACTRMHCVHYTTWRACATGHRHLIARAVNFVSWVLGYRRRHTIACKIASGAQPSNTVSTSMSSGATHRCSLTLSWDATGKTRCKLLLFAKSGRAGNLGMPSAAAQCCHRRTTRSALAHGPTTARQDGDGVEGIHTRIDRPTPSPFTSTSTPSLAFRLEPPLHSNPSGREHGDSREHGVRCKGPLPVIWKALVGDMEDACVDMI